MSVQCAYLGSGPDGDGLEMFGSYASAISTAPGSCGTQGFTGGYVVTTETEYFAQGSSLFPPLSSDDGASIGLAIFLAWTLAFGMRLLRRVIEEADLGSDNT